MEPQEARPYGTFRGDVARDTGHKKWNRVILFVACVAACVVLVALRGTSGSEKRPAYLVDIASPDAHLDGDHYCPPWNQYCAEHGTCLQHYHDGNAANPIPVELCPDYVADCKYYCHECDCQDEEHSYCESFLEPCQKAETGLFISSDSIGDDQLECPHGWQQVGDPGAGMEGCGLDDCAYTEDVRTPVACASSCKELVDPPCLSFSFSQEGDKPKCIRFDKDEATITKGADGILCKELPVATDEVVVLNPDCPFEASQTGGIATFKQADAYYPACPVGTEIVLTKDGNPGFCINEAYEGDLDDISEPEMICRISGNLENYKIKGVLVLPEECTGYQIDKFGQWAYGSDVENFPVKGLSQYKIKADFSFAGDQAGFLFHMKNVRDGTSPRYWLKFRGNEYLCDNCPLVSLPAELTHFDESNTELMDWMSYDGPTTIMYYSGEVKTKPDGGAALMESVNAAIAAGSADQEGKYCYQGVDLGNVDADYDLSGYKNRLLCGTRRFIGERMFIEFVVPKGGEGDYEFDFNVDFGWGGTFCFDGDMDECVANYEDGDMWWRNKLNVPQPLDKIKFLDRGPHNMTIFGAERCCDGLSNIRFKRPGSEEFEPLTYAALTNIDDYMRPDVKQDTLYHVELDVNGYSTVAGEYEVYYRGAKRDGYVTDINCHGLLKTSDAANVYSNDQLQFGSSVKDKCSEEYDMLLMNPHGKGKYECLVIEEDGKISGTHYYSNGVMYGSVAYVRTSETSCRDTLQVYLGEEGSSKLDFYGTWMLNSPDLEFGGVGLQTWKATMTVSNLQVLNIDGSPILLSDYRGKFEGQTAWELYANEEMYTSGDGLEVSDINLPGTTNMLAVKLQQLPKGHVYVSCSLDVDDNLDKIRYNLKDLWWTKDVTGNYHDYRVTKRFGFFDAGEDAKLEIWAHERPSSGWNFEACVNSGMFLKCEASDPSSKWHGFVSSAESFRAKGSNVPFDINLAEGDPARFHSDLAQQLPFQVPFKNGYCTHKGSTYQEVPGCGPVCNDGINRGMPHLGHYWDPVDQVPCSKCGAAKLPGCDGRPNVMASTVPGYCVHPGSIFQDVPGCGPVCSDKTHRGVYNKPEYWWGPAVKVPCSACPQAKWDGCEIHWDYDAICNTRWIGGLGIWPQTWGKKGVYRYAYFEGSPYEPSDDVESSHDAPSFALSMSNSVGDRVSTSTTGNWKCVKSEEPLETDDNGHSWFSRSYDHSSWTDAQLTTSSGNMPSIDHGLIAEDKDVNWLSSRSPKDDVSGVVVTCEATADNNIDVIMYNGKHIKSKLPNFNNWKKIDTFSFEDAGPEAFLVIKANEYDQSPKNGCRISGLMLTCVASDETSKWHGFSSDLSRWAAWGAQGRNDFSGASVGLCQSTTGAWMFDQTNGMDYTKIWPADGQRFALFAGSPWFTQGHLYCVLRLDEDESAEAVDG